MHSVQLKLEDCQVDYGRQHEDLREQIKLNSHLVRSIKYGLSLEIFLDKYLGRTDSSKHTKPAFQEDPQLCGPSPSTSQATNFTEASSGDIINNALQNLQQETPEEQQLQDIHPVAVVSSISSSLLAQDECRTLLEVKRNGKVKARMIKQGFHENNEDSCYIKQRAMQRKKEEKNQEEANNKEAIDKKFSNEMISHILNSMKNQE